jgi:hypothetical protein
MLFRKPVTEQGGLRREGYGTRAHPQGTRPSLQNVVERFGQVMPTREFDGLLAHVGMKIHDQRSWRRTDAARTPLIYVQDSLPVRGVPAGFTRELSFHLSIFWAANLGCWEEHMEQAIRQATQADLVEPAVPGISWAAVLAGAVASLALTLVLISFGAGMGFSVVSPWGNSGVSASTFKIGTGLYFIVMAMISSAIGGYLAGRLRTKWVGVQTTEVYFRDTAHGFLAWAAASVLGAVLLASPASSLIGGTLSGATQAAANSEQSSPMDGYVDRLLRSDNPSAQGQQNPSDARGEMVRLFTSSFHNGNDLNPADRTYVAKVVAARTGLSQADAEKRVNDVVTQVKADLDAARKAAMQIAIWLTLSLFIGAFSASLAATEGGGLRDGTWGKKAYGNPAINR